MLLNRDRIMTIGDRRSALAMNEKGAGLSVGPFEPWDTSCGHLLVR
jgi:hypothetical protein